MGLEPTTPRLQGGCSPVELRPHTFWSGREDLNLRSPGSRPGGLRGLSYTLTYCGLPWASEACQMVAEEGIEPSPCGV